MCKKSGRRGRKPAWLSQNLLAKLKHKPKMHRQWRQGYTSWGDYREMAQECREGTRKSKPQLEMNLERDIKNKKGLFRYTGQQRKMKETVPLMMSETGEVATIEMKAEVLNNFFALVFISKCSGHATQFTDGKGRDWGSEVLPHRRRRSDSRPPEEPESAHIYGT